ncbi:hypothetical protein SAMN05444407_1033 [Chryseobacterium contaminans]|uniref:Uncharacterized protein n=1 Tax=Chryseobacterium contaminans TaxID=1423959 RepID=A0A1M6YXV2_9FLAO|nr:hypothetical protein SAMN05444407_1033 [Chryseobacterium contaminans]
MLSSINKISFKENKATQESGFFVDINYDSYFSSNKCNRNIKINNRSVNYIFVTRNEINIFIS